MGEGERQESSYLSSSGADNLFPTSFVLSKHGFIRKFAAMSVWHRFTAIALTCAFVGACAASDNGVETGGTEALVQQERLKFQVVLAGAGRGPWLERDHDNYLYAISYSDATIRKAFDDALTNEILARNIGKIVICDCEGHFTEGEKGKEFEVSSFTIHFELR